MSENQHHTRTTLQRTRDWARKMSQMITDTRRARKDPNVTQEEVLWFRLSTEADALDAILARQQLEEREIHDA